MDTIKDNFARYYGDERERTFRAYNLSDFDPLRCTDFYEFPTLDRCDFVPDRLIGFNYAKTNSDTNCGIHFFIDDYQFERVWNNPYKYIETLCNYECVLTPDFSLYTDMPMALKIWNVYRSRLIGQIFSDSGMQVIPTLQWAGPDTFDFCFDGIAGGGTVAVSTVGVIRNKEALSIFKAGLSAALEKIRPKTVLLYGSDIDFDFGETVVKRIQPRRWLR